ncbi:YfhO family protein [Lentilactobacillus hilgardii]|uniref:YfhO family protein n=1 Tax=Lentilactobacillus hilgardii TaxID=1588 RepID=UPI0039ED6CDB
MLKGTRKHPHMRYDIISILLPIVVVSLLFTIISIAPFGSRNLLISDLSTQYLQFFAELRRQLIHLSFSSYSFLISIGDSLIPVYAYYLLSPLNLIVIFFDPSQLPIAIDLIIWAKIILCSISMSTFLGHKYQRYDFMAICGGLAYGLCGFVSMYFYDLMWLDSLILLPIMIYGLEKLYKQNKVWLYVFGLTAIIMTNYYMGYIICIFSMIYFVYLMTKNQPNKMTVTLYLKSQVNRIGRFLWYSGLSGMLAAVVLIPTAISMMSTGKKDIHFRNFVLKGTFGPSFTVNLGFGGNDFAGRLVHNPSMFTGSVFIILGIVYFFSKVVSIRDKQASVFLLGSIFLGMWLLPLNTIWHLFQRPAGFPFRMVFLFSFALIMVAYEGYLKGIFKETRVVIFSAVSLGAAISVGYIWANIFGKRLTQFEFSTPQLSVNNFIYVLAMGFLVLTVVAIVSLTNRKPSSRVVLSGILIFELMMNFFVATMDAPFVNQPQFEKRYQQSEQAIHHVRHLKFTQNKFYRLLIMDQPYRNIYQVPYSGYNDSLLFENHGISSYSSTLNSHTHHVLASLGFSSRNIRRIDMLGGSVITNHLFGIKYYYVIGKHSQKLLVRKNAAQLGFMTNNQIQHVTYKRDQIFNNLNALVQAEAGNKGRYLYRSTITKYKQAVVRSNYHYEMQLQANTSGPHYIYIPKVRLYHVAIWVNGAKLSNTYSGLGTEMIPIGYLLKGQTATIRVQSTKPLPVVPKIAMGIDLKKFESVVAQSKNHQFELRDARDINKHGGHFRGTVQVSKRDRTLLMSFPYDKGWKLSVDGKPHKVIKVADGLVGAELSPGKHHLAFNYHIRGLGVGMLISILGMALLAISEWWRKKRVNFVKHLH